VCPKGGERDFAEGNKKGVGGERRSPCQDSSVGRASGLKHSIKRETRNVSKSEEGEQATAFIGR